MRLKGKRGLVAGIANDYAIATGCVRVFAAEGARLAVPCQNARALPRVSTIPTRAASGIVAFEGLIRAPRTHASKALMASIDAVRQVAAFLASDAASGLTGTLTHIDAGRHVRM